MDERFAQALIQAATQRANNLGGSPNQTAANAGQMGNLQNLAQLKFQNGAGEAAQGAYAGNAGATADINEKRAANEARITDINADTAEKLRQADAEKDNPANFQRVPAEDGGWNYFDGRGNAISVNDYAKARGERVTDALKDSQNPEDTEFLKEFNETKKLGAVMSGGSQDDLDKLYKENPALKERVDKLGVKTFSDYVQLFQKAYPSKFKSSIQPLEQQPIASGMQLKKKNWWE
jgi:hypothetical protein